VDEHYQTCQSPTICGFSICWPFLAYAGIKNYLTIHSVFEHEKIFRIKITDDENDRIVNTFITETKDLIAIVKTEREYKVFHIDLDQIREDNFIKKKLLF